MEPSTPRGIVADPPPISASAEQQCPLCPKTFGDRISLGTHMRNKHGSSLAPPTEEELKCKICGYEAVQMARFSRHYKEEHPGVPVPQPVPRDRGEIKPRAFKPKGTVPCPHCDFAAKTSKGLARHITDKHGNGTGRGGAQIATIPQVQARVVGTRVVCYCPVCGTNMQIVQQAINIAGGM